MSPNSQPGGQVSTIRLGEDWRKISEHTCFAQDILWLERPVNSSDRKTLHPSAWTGENTLFH